MQVPMPQAGKVVCAAVSVGHRWMHSSTYAKGISPSRVHAINFQVDGCQGMERSPFKGTDLCRKDVNVRFTFLKMHNADNLPPLWFSNEKNLYLRQRHESVIARVPSLLARDVAPPDSQTVSTNGPPSKSLSQPGHAFYMV